MLRTLVTGCVAGTEHAMGLRLADVCPTQGTASVFTFSQGNTLPIVSPPFGMNSWVPETVDAGPTGGWFYAPHSRRFYGLRCTHQPSPWVGDYGCFRLMPQAGERYLTPHAWNSAMFATDTTIAPHLFQTVLRRYGITVQFAPTDHAGLLRLIFASGAARRLIIGSIRDETAFTVDREAGLVLGRTRSRRLGCRDDFAFHFALRFPGGFQDVGWFEPSGAELPNGAERDQLGAWVELPREAPPVVDVEIGTSYIDGEQAVLNLRREVGGQSLAQVSEATAHRWSALLERLDVSGADDEQRRTLTTCLYRALLFPRRADEVDARGQTVHRSPYDGQVQAGIMVTDNGFWDTCRTVYPFLSIAYPDILGDTLQGWVNASVEGGWTPKWPSPGHRATMIGTHLDAVFADGYVKGISGWDAAAAYRAMKRNAYEVSDRLDLYGRVGLAEYLRLGYVPDEAADHSVSRTLDFAYGDWCIAQLAADFDTAEVRDDLLRRGQNYRHLFDPEVGFMRARQADGQWVPGFSPCRWGGPYVEGSAWQCGWAVYHDVPGLMSLYGGAGPFLAKLDELLATPPVFEVGEYRAEIHEMTEMAAVSFGQYAHSNQPSHHLLYLFALAGRPSTTQVWVRRVLDELYSSRPDGFCGDEDNGEMACWYLLSAMGLYPVCPGKAEYVLGSPLFPRLTVRRPDGAELVIEAEGHAPERSCVDAVALNGETVSGVTILHAPLATGGTLRFTMSGTA